LGFLNFVKGVRPNVRPNRINQLLLGGIKKMIFENTVEKIDGLLNSN